MIVLLDQNLVLLATPKTGTTALEAALAPHASMVVSNPPALKHTSLQTYKRFVQPYLCHVSNETPQTAALIRHPLHWLDSWYRCRGRPWLDGKPNSTAKMSYSAFIEAYLQDNRPSFANVGTQANMITDADNATVDHLFKYENINKYVVFLEGKLKTTL
ncbi:MAG: gamma-glutamyl kinase, partial [Halocynthiibacter sp.]